MKGFSYLENVVTLKLDTATCIGCGVCVSVCPHQVFIVVQQKAAIVAIDSCMECGACSTNCPVSAISVDAGVGCASGMINGWLTRLNIGRGGAGGCG